MIRSPTRENNKMKYDNETCNKFVEECETAGYEVRHYRGRSFWEGPAVRCDNQDEYHDVVRATTMRLQNDSLGYGYIVYPVSSGKLIDECEEDEE
jgi:hypothetical protein